MRPRPLTTDIVRRLNEGRQLIEQESIRVDPQNPNTQSWFDPTRGGRTQRAKRPRLEAVARFTKAVIATRGRVDDTEFEAFKAAGFTDEGALEVVFGVSLATLCNFANNLGGAPLNPQLEPYRWNGGSAAAAE
jgi:alkylhydroperoxidase family enzyme